MSLREKVISTFKERRDKLINGGVNSIPSPFKRFSNDFIGLEQGCYYLFSSFTKGAKTQLVSYILYEALMYVYNNSDVDIDIKIFYFNLEETKENVMTRFISWLLYTKSNGKYRYSPRDLMSSKNDKPLPQEVIDYMEEESFSEILDFFDSHVIFTEQTNPTGIYKACKAYCEENGTITYKPAKYKDENGVLHDTKAFDYYTPNNPNEYVFAVVDTINIIDTERGFTKKQSIDKLSEYFILLRNRYNLSPIVIQQQNTDNESIESVKFNRTRPTTAGLGDSKYTAHDANIAFGIFSPFKFGIPEYMGYDIKLLKDRFRTLEVLINRNGEVGGIIPLFFDGAVCNWSELPKSDDTLGMHKVYTYIKKLQKENNPVMTIIGKIKHLINKNNE